MLGLDIAAIRKGAAAALAPVLAKKSRAEVPAALGAALAVALAESKGKSISVLMAYCRPAGALHALVRAALGRKPRQERQGHHAARGARPGRSAQPGATVHRRAARQVVHCRHRRRARAWARASTANSPSSPASRDLPARPSAIWSPRKARATAETLAKNGCPVRTIHIDEARRGKPRRTADAFHAGDDHRRASARHRRLRPAGGGRGQGAGEEVFDA